MKRTSTAKQPLGPQHLVGAGIIVVGVAGLAKLFIVLGHSKTGGSQRAQLENERGQYGSRP